MDRTLGTAAPRDRTHRHTLPLDLAAELRAARRRLGLSVRAASERVGIDPTGGYLSCMERGLRCPSVVVADLLHDGLQLDAGVAERLYAAARPGTGRAWPGPRTR